MAISTGNTSSTHVRRSYGSMPDHTNTSATTPKSASGSSSCALVTLEPEAPGFIYALLLARSRGSALKVTGSSLREELLDEAREGRRLVVMQHVPRRVDHSRLELRHPLPHAFRIARTL